MANASCGLCSALNACSGWAEPGSDTPPPPPPPGVECQDVLASRPCRTNRPWALGVVTIPSTFLGWPEANLAPGLRIYSPSPNGM